MLKDVRQREFAIAVRGQSIGLVTGNVSTCRVLVGINDSAEIAFLAHFDTPWSVDGMETLVRKLQQHGANLADFRLYTYGGVSTTLVSSLGGAGVALLAFEPFSAFMLLACSVAWCVTRLRLHLWLRRTPVFGKRPVHLGCVPWALCGRNSSVQIYAAAGALPCIRDYWRKQDVQRFAPSASLYLKQSPQSD